LVDPRRHGTSRSARPEAVASGAAFTFQSEEDEVSTNEPVSEPPDPADGPDTAPVATTGPDADDTPVPPEPAVVAAEPAPSVPSSGPLRVLSIIVIVAGFLLIVAGVVTWFVVRDQLAAEKIVVSEDAPFLGGNDVDGPFSAYAEAEAINDHALEASGGLTYAQLEQDDPTRDTVMTASFLRASLFTSVVSFGVAVFAFGVGIVLILIGWALLRIDRVLRRFTREHQPVVPAARGTSRR
jgi:uncharacterized membrane protein